jgi:malate synthase
MVTLPGNKVQVSGPDVARADEVLTPEALAFVADLQARFGPDRDALLAARAARHAELASGRRVDVGTAEIRDADWQVPPAPPGLVDRRVEITGPTEPKMAINALNCGANVWLADLEDANTPHWRNVVGGQVVLRDAVRKTLAFTAPDGREYRLREDGALPTIVPRPRGWHLPAATPSPRSWSAGWWPRRSPGSASWTGWTTRGGCSSRWPSPTGSPSS